jgi:hypothetical protein
MPADRLPEFVVALLLVTSFTIVGWLALWAAFSTINWFARTLVILACLAPLLAAAAYEPFVAFVLQCSLIVLAIQFGRWWTIRQRLKAAQATGASTENLRPASWRFSLMTLLQVTVLVAIGSWVALKLPKLNSIAWINVCYIAGAAAMASMAGALLCVSKKNLLRLMAIVGCFLLGADRAWFDLFLPSLTNSFSNWPPDPGGNIAAMGFGVPSRPIIVWFFIPVFIALLTAIFVWLQIYAFLAPQKSTGDPTPVAQTVSLKQRRRARVGLAVLVLLVVPFPLYVLGKLLTPDPLPTTTMPNPNGYDDLAAAGKAAETTAFETSGFDYETASEQALAAEVGKCGTVYDLVAKGIAKECLAPANYSSDGILPMDTIVGARTTARVLAGKARLEELKGNFDAAARADVQTIQFSNQFRRGGFIVQALVGIACSGYGTEPLYKQRDKLSGQQLADCIAQLSRLDAQDEPYADVLQRDRVWAQRAFGWYGHLHQIVDDIGDNHVHELLQPLRGYQYAYWGSQARLRLLIVELALTRFHQDTKHWPRSLDELVPKYLAYVPVDPLSPTGDTLKYRPTDDGYILYSLGANCIDDNGANPDETQSTSPLAPETGDLRLDWSYRPQNNATSQPPSTGSPSTGNQSPPADPGAAP